MQDYVAQNTLVPTVPKSTVEVQLKKSSEVKPPPTHDYRASKRQRRSSSGHGRAPLPETPSGPAQSQRHVTPVCKKKKDPSETTNDQVRNSKVTMAMESSTAIQPKKCKKVRPPPNQTSMAIERQKTHIGASSAQGMAQLQESQSMPPTAQSQVTPFVTMPTGHSETTQVPVAFRTPAVVQARKRKKVRPPPKQTSNAIERKNTYIGASSAQGTVPLGETQSMPPTVQSQVSPFVHKNQGDGLHEADKYRDEKRPEAKEGKKSDGIICSDELQPVEELVEDSDADAREVTHYYGDVNDEVSGNVIHANEVMEYHYSCESDADMEKYIEYATSDDEKDELHRTGEVVEEQSNVCPAGESEETGEYGIGEDEASDTMIIKDDDIETSLDEEGVFYSVKHLLMRKMWL
ncbi:uncharacterized protein LOC135488439 [Lineus longissimus]|uniref:uncharacterized protein LOC135488439 n=1 Tax=Lineus longissimus TaxID=88925 RepID=UPI00315E00E4